MDGLSASAAVIVYTGTKLSRHGDQIAKLTGLSGLWIGVVLMAAATSLPEVFTTVSAGFMAIIWIKHGGMNGKAE
jgi:cation:H+ antiporter